MKWIIDGILTLESSVNFIDIQSNFKSKKNNWSAVLPEWSERVKNNYVEKFDQIVNQLRTFPEIGQETELLKGLRRLVITKQTTIYYRHDNKHVKIATIFDTRMDPKKIKKEIK